MAHAWLLSLTVLASCVEPQVLDKSVAVSIDAAFVQVSWDLMPFFEAIRSTHFFLEKMIKNSTRTYTDGSFHRARSELSIVRSEVERLIGVDPVEAIFKPSLDPGKATDRTKRASPLSFVSDVADLALGFTGHTRFNNYKNLVETKFKLFSVQHEALKSLTEFGLNQLQNQLLSISDSLNIVKLKVSQIEWALTLNIRLEAALAAINRGLLRLISTKHRADQSYISRYVLDPRTLGLFLLQLNDATRNLHPIYTSTEASQYYRVKCASSTFNGTHFVTIIRVPLISHISTFKVVLEQNEGVVNYLTLRNNVGLTYMHFTEYITCLGANLPNPFTSWCSLRACILKKPDNLCVSINETTYYIMLNQLSHGAVKIHCPTQTFEVSVRNASIITLPLQCSVNDDTLMIQQAVTRIESVFSPDIRTYDNLLDVNSFVAPRFVPYNALQWNAHDQTTSDVTKVTAPRSTLATVSTTMAIASIVCVIALTALFYLKLKPILQKVKTVALAPNRLDELVASLS